ncbi:bifunctional DNA primase/polymerase [Corynebacterium variabile]|uniref:bifunctional DNA primase/polymerase n=1 Tax=Corynebacterium variabile TaxID=1727 RepID=UPI003F8F4E9C
MSKTTSTTAAELMAVVETYRRAGWPTPFPLPAGEKFPPVAGCTGEAPSVEDAARDAEAAWNEITNGQARNMGLRMPADVIALDVDDYGDRKHGAETLYRLTEALGDLPPTFSSTRRGAESPARHLFFRVPAGVKWSSAAGPGIDILQHTHRYAVVWPSVVDGDMYRWYDVDGNVMPEGEIPNVEDLTELPAVWVDALKKSEITGTPRPELSLSRPAAWEWLRENVRNPNAETTGPLALTEWTSGALADLFNPDNCGSRHDEMVSLTRVMIRTALETGAEGLLSLLETVRSAFYDAYAGGDDRRPDPAEFDRAVHGEVEKIRGEVEAGLYRPFAVLAASVTGLSPEVFTALRSDRPANLPEVDGVDAVRRVVLSSPAPIVAVADLVALLYPDLVTVRVRGGRDLVRDERTNAEVTDGDLRRILAETVSMVTGRVVGAEEEDTPDHEKARKVHGEVSRLIGAANLTALTELLANAVTDTGRVLSAEDLDRNPWLIGVGDEVLDLSKVESNPGGSLADWMRPRTYDDAVTKSAPVDVAAGLAALEHRAASPVESHRETCTEKLIAAVFPDPAVRRFAQKALGYSMSGSNKMHKFFVWFGPGGGGKGSVMDSVTATLGTDYVSEMTPHQFIKGSGSRPDPDYAASLGTRLSFVNETEEGQEIDAAAIKRATEVRSGRALYSNEVVKTDANTVTVMTNRPFKFKTDSAVERRLAVIPFDTPRAEIAVAQPSPMGEPWRERPEEQVWFLLWLIEGYRLAVAEGLDVEDYPAGVAEATRGFIEEADPSARFFRMLERTGDPEDFLPTTEMVRKYRNVTGVTVAEATDRQVSMKFSRWFKDRGHPSDAYRQGNGGSRGFRNWRLTDPDNVVEFPRLDADAVEDAHADAIA